MGVLVALLSAENGLLNGAGLMAGTAGTAEMLSFGQIRANALCMTFADRKYTGPKTDLREWAGRNTAKTAVTVT